MSMHKRTAQLLTSDSKKSPEDKSQKSFCLVSEKLSYEIYKATLEGKTEIEHLLSSDKEFVEKIKKFYTDLGYNVMLFKLVTSYAIYINWKGE